MWSRVEYTIKPLELDIASSSTLVYIRKNISYVEATEGRDAHWEADEHTVKKEHWELYKSILDNASALSDVEDALMELAELIVEE